MKKIILRTLASTLLVGFLMISGSVLADAPPDPGEDPNGGGGTPVGGSPIGGGLIILSTLAIGYGARKVYEIRSDNN